LCALHSLQETLGDCISFPFSHNLKLPSSVAQIPIQPAKRVRFMSLDNKIADTLNPLSTSAEEFRLASFNIALHQINVCEPALAQQRGDSHAFNRLGSGFFQIEFSEAPTFASAVDSRRAVHGPDNSGSH